jgi:integrase
MGLRRGEIIGLRWEDLALEQRVLYVRQQTQRRRGVLYDDDPKSRRRRAVPLPAMCIVPLRWHRMRQAAVQERVGDGWKETGHVFATRTRPPTPGHLGAGHQPAARRRHPHPHPPLPRPGLRAHGRALRH